MTKQLRRSLLKFPQQIQPLPLLRQINSIRLHAGQFSEQSRNCSLGAAPGDGPQTPLVQYKQGLDARLPNR